MDRLYSHGTRAQVLACLSIIWLAIALGTLTSPTSTPGSSALLHTHIPIPIRVIIWSVPGIAALLAVFWRQLDAFAWALLWVPPFERFCSYLIGWIVSMVDPESSAAFPPGWLGALVYAALCVLVNRCAKGLDRPPRMPELPSLPRDRP